MIASRYQSAGPSRREGTTADRAARWPRLTAWSRTPGQPRHLGGIRPRAGSISEPGTIHARRRCPPRWGDGGGSQALHSEDVGGGAGVEVDVVPRPLPAELGIGELVDDVVGRVVRQPERCEVDVD